MSNPETYYLTINNSGIVQDLSGIFQPISLGTSYSTPTGFKLSNGQDLNTIFANISSGSSLGYNVGYIFNGTDLSQIFAKYESTYKITDSSGNMNVTTINYNGYTGLIFENTSAPSTTATSATCNITFFISKSINILVVGGSGGAAAGNRILLAGGGSGGAGFVNTSFNSTVNSSYSISVGSGGIGRKAISPGIGNFGKDSAGYAGADSSFSLSSSLSLIAYAGEIGLGLGAVNNYTGGGGGSARNDLNNTGGGGGGGGGGAAVGINTSDNLAPSNPSKGALNTSYNLGNLGQSGSKNYNRGNGGKGGEAYSNKLTPPFLPTGSIYFGNGGGGGANYFNGKGGKAGSTTGGDGYGSSSGFAGEDAIYGLKNGNYFYGNGGGGGSSVASTPSYGGNGGNGVVILWWSNPTN